MFCLLRQYQPKFYIAWFEQIQDHLDYVITTSFNVKRAAIVFRCHGDAIQGKTVTTALMNHPAAVGLINPCSSFYCFLLLC